MNQERRKVSLIGLGWLGAELAAELLAKGYDSSGTVTSVEKADQLHARGIKAEVWKFDSNAPKPPTGVADAAILIITLPPRGNYAEWLEALRYLVNSASDDCLLVYTGSTGVYRQGLSDTVSIAKEDAALSEGPLLQVEQLIMNAGKPWLIFRLAGLVGGTRQPARFLAGKVGVKAPDAPVNLVHRDDVVQCISAVLAAGVSNEVFNVCSDVHPLKREYYPEMARRSGLIPPEFDLTDKSSGYLVSNEKVKSFTGIQLRYPDPFLFD